MVCMLVAKLCVWSSTVLSIHVANNYLVVQRFDHEGLHQVKNSFVPDEDLRWSKRCTTTIIVCYMNAQNG